MMRYTGTQRTQQEAESIMRETRARLDGTKFTEAEKPKPAIRRCYNPDLVYKTPDVVNARVPASEAANEQASSWAEWVNAQIEARVGVLRDAIVEHYEQELDEVVERLEREINGVRRDLNHVRNQVDIDLGLSARVTALKSEVERARSQAPDFKTDLSDLQEDVEALRRSMGSLRAQNSTLEFKQNQLSADQKQAKEKVTLTAVQLSAVGGATREVLQRLRDSGFDLTEGHRAVN